MIRPLRPEDAEELATLLRANREHLAPFEPERPEEVFTTAGQRERLERAAEREERRFAILDEEAIAGTINLTNVIRGPLQSANVGYWVDRGRTGRGLATGAVAAILEVAFGELGLHRVEAGTLVENVASQRVLEKNGFERLGLAPRYLRVGGEWRDHVLFQRLAED